MYSLTINGNTPEELYKNLEQMVESYASPVNHSQAAVPTMPTFTPPPQMTPPTAPVAPVNNAAISQPTPPPIATPAPAAASAPAETAQNLAAFAPPPSAAPTYSLEALARAGASLAQSGKMTEALALLAKYGVQTVNQLKPEQYGAFATELRALGAQV